MVSEALKDKMNGVLLGTAVGDALGLPAEGLSPKRIRQRWGNDWKMRLFLGRGMISDDTEHTIMVAQSLIAHQDDPVAFQKALAWKLRWWFVALPAGVGLATAKACLKLWCGFPADRSGIRSAGNGPAMRVAIIGAVFANDSVRREEFTIRATRLTHTDVRAEIAARAVVKATAWIVRGEKPLKEFLPQLSQLGDDKEWQAICDKLIEADKTGVSVGEFARLLGLEKGVTGYALHTVPVALYACARHENDFRAALVSAVSCGGDTDTVGAIVGALSGAQVGRAGIPSEWVNRVCEWPRSVGFLELIATRLTKVSETKANDREVDFFWPGVIPRNLFFLAVVLAHGFRRLLPPY